jgi:hypothetical protein
MKRPVFHRQIDRRQFEKQEHLNQSDGSRAMKWHNKKNTLDYLHQNTYDLRRNVLGSKYVSLFSVKFVQDMLLRDKYVKYYVQYARRNAC